MAGDGPVARVRFEADWREMLEGELRPGGRLVVDYTAARRRQVFGGRRSGGVVLHARFEPGGQRQCVQLGGEPAALAVPVDAAEVVVWFQATEHAGGEAWDSRFGENYRYPVDRA
jgi:hypothetical protein